MVMLKKVRIGENSPHPLYVPKDLVDDGFIGDVDMIPDTKTFIILHPNASLDEIAISIENILRDINLRRGLETSKVETTPIKNVGK